jgi:glycine/D-amino acid oxidase-like deaminating enzyme
MSRRFDAVVVGAGIVGAACALELAREGLRIAVVEGDAIGSGATAAGMGHIVVMDDSEAQFALTHYSQSLWRELAAELPASVEYQRTGTIWVAADDEEMNEVQRKLSYYSSRNVPAEKLDPRALAEAEPNLRPGLAGGLLIPSDQVLYPPCAAAYLLEKARRHSSSLTMFLGQRASSIGNGRAVLQDGTLLEAPILINATGALSPSLTPGIAVKNRKGHLIITDRYPGFLRHQLVELGYLKSAHSTLADSVAFNVQPRKTGQILIGSSRQYDANHTGVDRPIVDAMIARAALYMPEIPKLSALRVWTGFRASTQDKLPLIGPIIGPQTGPQTSPAADSTVFLATGHEGLGITTSLATGKLLADHLLGRASAIPLEPYLPERLMRSGIHSQAIEESHG